MENKKFPFYLQLFHEEWKSNRTIHNPWSGFAQQNSTLQYHFSYIKIPLLQVHLDSTKSQQRNTFLFVLSFNKTDDLIFRLSLIIMI